MALGVKGGKRGQNGVRYGLTGCFWVLAGVFWWGMTKYNERAGCGEMGFNIRLVFMRSMEELG